MLARLSSLNTFRLWAALLVAIIGLQATAPTVPSTHKTDGSAFSASTYEVALYVQRADRGQRQAVVPLMPASHVVGVSMLPPAPAALIERAAFRPDSTGPPLRDIHSWQPAPRGPPRA